jgi:hypothetical protein
LRRGLGGDRRSARIEAHAGRIIGMLDGKPDITLAQIQTQLARAGVAAGIGTIARFFERHRITRKKKTAHAAEQDRPDTLMAIYSAVIARRSHAIPTGGGSRGPCGSPAMSTCSPPRGNRCSWGAPEPNHSTAARRTAPRSL